MKQLRDFLIVIVFGAVVLYGVIYAYEQRSLL